MKIPPVCGTLHHVPVVAYEGYAQDGADKSQASPVSDMVGQAGKEDDPEWKCTSYQNTINAAVTRTNKLTTVLQHLLLNLNKMFKLYFIVKL